MPSAPFSIRLDEDLKERLKSEAESADRSTSYLAAKAIEAFLEARETKRRAIQEAIQEADKGVFVSRDAVHDWLESWEGNPTAPAPKADIQPKT